MILATVRTNAFKSGRRPALPLVQAALRGRARHAPAGAALGDLRLLARRWRACTCAAASSPAAASAGRDRLEDYRTEILGLMKAQMVKNAVIVPAGAKGGFVLKQPPADRAELREEERRQYIDADARHARPHRQHRRRRGAAAARACACSTPTPTPTWWWRPTRAPRTCPTPPTRSASSTASGWATRSPPAARPATTTRSSGSPPRAPGRASSATSASSASDVMTEPFTVVGIGDMSGDVFGNGMLLSPVIRLVAAFDHRHVFIDPDPDPAAGARRAAAAVRAGRQLLGRLRPRADLGRAAASGRAAPRRSPLSPQARAALGIGRREAVAHRALPGDPAGAGRPVLERRHRHLRQGGRRVARRGRRPRQRRAARRRRRAAGPGGGRGRQPRLHPARPHRVRRRRRRINTDAIDNSAGVDCSDHEVNLKILLALADRGRRADRSTERNELLESVADDVVAPRALRQLPAGADPLARRARRPPQRMEAYEELMVELEASGLLERELEFLPSTDADGRARRRPAAAWCGRSCACCWPTPSGCCASRSLASTLPDDPYLDGDLAEYFPPHGGRAVRRSYLAAPPAAARDRRHDRHQRRHQLDGHHLRVADGGRDRRQPGRGLPRRSWSPAR